MRLVLLSMVDRGFPSVCLPALHAAFGDDLRSIVFARAAHASRSSRVRSMLRKVWRIGPRGAVNGVRMRRWYREDVADALRLEPLATVAARLGVPLHVASELNGTTAMDLVRGAGADLGIALGTTWIAPRLFELPRLGMINVHHELLPEFRNAQSVVWSLHEGRRTTGFTIHRIARKIDAGDVLWREEVPIVFRETLGETVTATCVELFQRSAVRLVEVVRDFDRLASAARPQGPGRSFTTPTWREFRRICREFERLRQG